MKSSSPHFAARRNKELFLLETRPRRTLSRIRLWIMHAADGMHESTVRLVLVKQFESEEHMSG
jgi:hypothetical protein